MSAWYETAVFYEVPVFAFADGNGDGTGDFIGLADRLDYLAWLGVDCLWLLPFYVSPRRDGGYDVADFNAVDPRYGSNEDVERFLAAAHERGLKVIADVVVNHTSDQHPWFQQARRPGSEVRSRYVWSDDPTRYSDARVIFIDTHDSNWAWDEEAGAYYWHRFFDHQPDLNFDDPWVREAIKDVVRFWLNAGFDGLRLDAVPYLYEREGTNGENLPETHGYLKELRAMVDAEYDDRILLAEANQWPEDVVAYFGDGDQCHMAFHFPVMPRLFMALAMGEATPIIEVMDRTPDLPPGCQWGIFLRNHDELTLEMVTEEERAFMYDWYAPDRSMRKNLGIRRRLAPLLDGDRRKIELLHGLLLSLPGSPFLYYGDEIGMGDNHLLEDRDGVRTPMQWDDSEGAGFSSAGQNDYYLPLVTSAEYVPARVNVASQREDPSSLLRWVRDLLAVRRKLPTLGTGDHLDLAVADPAVFCFVRRGPDGTVLVAANFSDADVVVTPEVTERHWADVACSLPGWSADEGLELGPYQFRWLVPSQ
jgi:maltose alpha-D-glucosyltransferase/alpha-amylase